MSGPKAADMLLCKMTCKPVKTGVQNFEIYVAILCIVASTSWKEKKTT